MNCEKNNGALIKATRLCKSYRLPHKTVSALENASIEAESGELVAIVGASGSGKSTLLHALGGLDRPDSGDVLLNGVSFYAQNARRRAMLRAEEIGFIFQAYHLLPEMNILENVVLAAMAPGRMSRREMRRRAIGLLESVGLGERLTHKPMELSGGEQQRVAIVRALMNSPSLILADEPTGNLDGQTGSQLLNILFSLTRDAGKAMIIVTHDPQIAARCDRRLLLKNGCLTPMPTERLPITK